MGGLAQLGGRGADCFFLIPGGIGKDQGKRGIPVPENGKLGGCAQIEAMEKDVFFKGEFFQIVPCRFHKYLLFLHSHHFCPAKAQCNAGCATAAAKFEIWFTRSWTAFERQMADKGCQKQCVKAKSGRPFRLDQASRKSWIFDMVHIWVARAGNRGNDAPGRAGASKLDTSTADHDASSFLI